MYFGAARAKLQKQFFVFRAAITKIKNQYVFLNSEQIFSNLFTFFPNSEFENIKGIFSCLYNRKNKKYKNILQQFP